MPKCGDMDPETPPNLPDETPVAPAAGPETDPPPAAAIVASGQRTEREIELESELQRERDRAAGISVELTSEREIRKQREVRLSELEDENHRIKTALAPAKNPVRTGPGFGFFNV